MVVSWTRPVGSSLHLHLMLAGAAACFVPSRFEVHRHPGDYTEVRLGRLRRARSDIARSAATRTGGRVFLFLTTDDIWRDYRTYMSRGVEFQEKPRHEEYGMVAVFTDRYGNRWDLIERHAR